MDLMYRKNRRDRLCPGDHIYTWRTGYSYSHHGIYVDDGKVIHLTRGPGFIISSSSTSQNGVVSCRIEDFLRDGQLHRFKYGVNPVVFLIKRAGTCSLAPSSSPEQVLHRAFYLHKHGFGNYNLLGKNCEDFAIYCKTGIPQGYGYLFGRSGQIKSLAAAFFAFTTIPYGQLPFSLIGLAPVVCGLYCFFRLAYDVGFKSQRGAVAVEKLNHLSDTQKEMMEKTSTRWSLSFKRYFGYTLFKDVSQGSSENSIDSSLLLRSDHKGTPILVLDSRE
ncbi:hypothetical protein FNV43_RR25538 [Rhamnella rubrinervis]|uniref:LRAT domain-containing protein n=1 Tax=Rhamnella rubrinervis TaxID=2594499 RepID=A0A8K0DNS0_9ROSA|nr:hypothetical protein FNV43_RR25538 [Rhamnella rubrinervis]